MPAPTESSPDAGSPAQWLRARDDTQLADLLRARPDLALPAPADLDALAARMSVRTSVQRAVDGLDAFGLRVLEALTLAAGPGRSSTGARPVRLADAAALLGPLDAARLDDALLDDAVRQLTDLALIWGAPPALELAVGVADVLGPYPAGLGRPARDLLAPGPAAVLADPRQLAELIAACDSAERSILDRLAAGPPVGTVSEAGAELDRPPAPDSVAPVLRLLARGLLARLDPRTVELPREVGVALRERPVGAVEPQPPPIELVEHAPADLDRAGGTAVLDALRLTETLCAFWTEQPPRQLRAGGLGVRDLRLAAARLGMGEPAAAVLIETAAAAGLVDIGDEVPARYLPTADYDTWLGLAPAARWTRLALAWLDMTRQPSLADRAGGRRADRDRPAAVLGPDVERGTAPQLRGRVLDLLATLPPGAAPRDRAAVLAALAWQAPRRAAVRLPGAEAVLAEADLLGLTAGGGLTGYTRTLRAGSRAVAEQVLAGALPDPVGDFLVQPDLTLVVPGPPTAELAATLGRIADLESAGGASVYRITESTVRRAMDSGRSAAQLHEFLRARSRTPVPQALSYLIDDAARRHGALRTGTAASYLRSDDTALLGRAAADRSLESLGLRLLAPTVAVSPVPVPRLLAALRAAGYAPAAEAADGVFVALEAEPARAPSRPSRPARRRSAVGSGQLGQLVRALRAGDALSTATASVGMHPRGDRVPAPATPTMASATTMGVLRDAIRSASQVLVESVDSDGSSARHRIWPISMAGGVVRGHEPDGGRLTSFPLHRVTRVVVLDDDEPR